MTPALRPYSDAETLEFPGAITLRILLTGDQTGGSMEVFEDIVQPGIGPGRHIHLNQDETFFFLEGQFDVEIDGKLHHMTPGDVAFIPRGTVHAFKNVGNTPGRLRYIFSPALQVEAMFRAFHAALTADALTPDEMARIAKVHGQEFVGPPL
ncbi:cupin domain-containing protein [Tropicibacter sp. Alg240-R139]|uniref:cupin domain-containing protein n=1 Tax=Tropicibacter sp. Alg240-R139 TaxID=2305991 RepID=UPI0013E0A072|nr:cupin domain-containing protein [Tropicibacter sp. Alg240-R139]